MKFYTRLLLFCFAATTAVFLWGQQPKQPEQPAKDQEGFKIGVEVNMVTVPVTVRRHEGGFVKSIPQSAFHIYEDGTLQDIVFFSQEGVSTHIAIVLDASGSVRTEWGTIKYATKKFLENLKPEDEFSLFSFNSEIRMKMDWGRKIERLDAVLTSIYCKDNTKLWDTIWAVCNDAFKGIEDKKAMIIMSDGLDNESSVSFNDALQAAIRSEAALYIVSKTEAVRQMIMYEQRKQGIYDNIPQQVFVEADYALRRLAYETGGRVLYPNSFGQLDNIYAQVDEELRNQYTIGYVSTNTRKDGTYRHIDVRVDAPDIAVSARPGYYAPEDWTAHEPARKK